MLKNKFNLGEEVTTQCGDSKGRRWIVTGMHIQNRVGFGPRILYTISLLGTTEDNENENICPFYFGEDELISVENQNS